LVQFVAIPRPLGQQQQCLIVCPFFRAPRNARPSLSSADCCLLLGCLIASLTKYQEGMALVFGPSPPPFEQIPSHARVRTGNDGQSLFSSTSIFSICLPGTTISPTNLDVMSALLDCCLAACSAAFDGSRYSNALERMTLLS
jgi:hypothetical protein